MYISLSSKSNLTSEDRLYLSPIYNSVADGAGGTSILCGEWAEYVLNRLSESPIADFKKFVEWLESFTEGFIDHYEPQIARDNFQLRKFYKEGSACTLACIWQIEDKIHWLTYGDSHVFFISPKRFSSFPFKSREEFSRGTYLLNWLRYPDPEGFQCGVQPADSEMSVLLATDEISKHIFYLRDNAPDFPSALEMLYSSMSSEEDFRAYIRKHPDIGEDDYTLIFIKP